MKLIFNKKILSQFIILLIMLEGKAAENRISKSAQMVAIGATLGAVGAMAAYRLHNKYCHKVKDYAYASAMIAGPQILSEGMMRLCPKTLTSLSFSFPLSIFKLRDLSYNVPFVVPMYGHTFSVRQGIYISLGLMVAEVPTLFLRGKIVDVLISNKVTVGFVAVGGLCGVGAVMATRAIMERRRTAQLDQGWKTIIEEPKSRVLSPEQRTWKKLSVESKNSKFCDVCLRKGEELYHYCDGNIENFGTHCDGRQNMCQRCKVTRLQYNEKGIWACTQRNKNCKWVKGVSNVR